LKVEQQVSFFVRRDVLEKYIAENKECTLFNFSGLFGTNGEMILTITPVREHSLLGQGRATIFGEQTRGIA
jgi:hypothetical protein